MSFKGFTSLVLAASLVLAVAAARASAQGSTSLKFFSPPAVFTGVGFDPNNPNAIPPVGSSVVFVVKLENIGTEFGKPAGTIVGHAYLDCTVLQVYSAGIASNCSGIAHVPNGYFTFAGGGNVFSNAKVGYYDITGGVGPYANDRGEIVTDNNTNGSSVETITLTS